MQLGKGTPDPFLIYRKNQSFTVLTLYIFLMPRQFYEQRGYFLDFIKPHIVFKHGSMKCLSPVQELRNCNRLNTAVLSRPDSNMEQLKSEGWIFVLLQCVCVKISFKMVRGNIRTIRCEDG